MKLVGKEILKKKKNPRNAPTNYIPPCNEARFSKKRIMQDTHATQNMGFSSTNPPIKINGIPVFHLLEMDLTAPDMQ